MNNGQNGQNSVNSQYSNTFQNYQYNPQGNGMANTQYPNQQPQYGYPNQGNVPYQYPQNQGYPQYQQYPQTVPQQNQYQYGSNLNGLQPNDSKKKKKKFILLIGIAVVVLLIVILVIFFLGKDKKKKPTVNTNSNGTEETSYEAIMKQYGESVETNVSTYLKENETLPSKNTILDSSKIDGYSIACEIVEFYSSGKVYLSKCTINNSERFYTYGEEENENTVMEDYGKKALTYVSDYVKINKVLPGALDVKFDKKVECDTVKIYNENTIYLNDCSINGSDKKYTFGYPREDGYVYISYTAYNNDIMGETTTLDYLSDAVEKKQLKCSTNKCILDKYLGPYAAVKESDGRIILHNIQSTSSLFTVASNLTYTFIEKDGKEVYGLLLRNQKGQEAIYSLSENAMKKDYGTYYYNWEAKTDATNAWEKYTSLETKNLLVPVKKEKTGKYGLISLRNNKEVLPFEYDSMYFDGEYINVVKNNKRGLINQDGNYVLLGGNFYDEFVLADYQSKYIMAYDNDELQIIDLNGKLIKKVAEIPRGYVLLKDDGYSGMTYKEESGKAIFTILFKTDKVGNPCAKYTYNLTNSTLNIDENKCESFK